ncbi:MAG: hypothetical protein H5U07_11140, partial [Candidatus Aminicenantes bacterium]|nr:hypothetical protein [Candidatus Aminicenantes bacterium]
MMISFEEPFRIKKSKVLSFFLTFLVITAWMLLPVDAGAQKLKPINEPKVGLPASAPQPWVVGVWMHPGMFGREKEAAAEKIRQTLDE